MRLMHGSALFATLPPHFQEHPGEIATSDDPALLQWLDEVRAESARCLREIRLTQKGDDLLAFDALVIGKDHKDFPAWLATCWASC